MSNLEVTVQKKGKRLLGQVFLVAASSLVSSSGTAAFVSKEDAARDTRISVIETRVDGLSKTLDEIKRDVKELLRRPR